MIVVQNHSDVVDRYYLHIDIYVLLGLHKLTIT